MEAVRIANSLGGKKSGGGWLCRCPAHNDRNPSLSLKDGSNGHLLVKCFAGCDTREIFAALRARGFKSQKPDSSVQSKITLKNSWSNKAQYIWDISLPLEGSIAATYLHQRCHALPNSGDIRFLPGKFIRPPAMLSKITDTITGIPISLHFTFLKPDGSGKADIERQKILLSGHRKSGGVIRLSPDDEVTRGLGIAEGVETALTIARAWRPMWATIDASNMANFPVLDGIESLTIFADHDKAGIEAANKCAARWCKAGREVKIVPPKTYKADWNDVYRGAI